MKARILLLAAGIATLSSCSSLYKSGQTPDDVYYSPARPAAEYVQSNNDQDEYQSYQQYQDSYRNDRFLRMSIQNPYYMSAYNDYDGFDWRLNAYASYWSSPWSNYWAWNNFYNPYSCYYMAPVGYGGYLGGYNKNSFSNSPVSKPVAFSGNSYNSGSNSNRYVYRSNGTYYNPGSAPRYNNNNSYTPASNNNNNSSNAGSYHNNNTYTPTRSYSPAPSSGGSSSGGGGGGGISRPTRN